MFDLPPLPPPLEHDQDEDAEKRDAPGLDVGPIEDAVPQGPVLSAPSGTGTRQMKRLFEEPAAGSSGAGNKRPRRACTIRIGTILIGER